MSALLRRKADPEVFRDSERVIDFATLRGSDFDDLPRAPQVDCTEDSSMVQSWSVCASP